MSRALSAYARQFLDQLQKPDVDFIEGLSPAIAIEQRSSGSSPRSIIATTTEIYDYLRLLYAHIGQAHCPETGVPISTQSTSDIVDKILALPPKTKVMLLAPVVRRQKGEFRDVFERLAREGFVRVRVDGEIAELGENIARIKLDKKKFHNIEAVVDRLVIDEKIRVRLGDSVQTALRLGEGVMFTLHQLPEESKVQSPKSKAGEPAPVQSEIRNPKSEIGSRRCTRTKCVRPRRAKVTIRRRRNIFPSTRPPARVPVCHGLGQKMVFDEALVVPDADEPLESAIQPWRRAGKRMNIYYKAMLRSRRRAFQRRHWRRLGRICRRISKKFCSTVPARTTWNSNSGARARSAALTARLKACCRISNGWRPTAKANSSATGSRLTWRRSSAMRAAASG